MSGSVRVWDCKGEGATKGTYPIISGRINDLAWDGDSQRIIAVGDGRERFGHCITFDTGNSVGEISGHSSQVNSVSIRQQRPLRAATGSDDTSVVFYHGAPFKFATSQREEHKNFIYGVGFSPDGASLVSVGADRKIWLYDGKTGEVKNQVSDGEHKGSIFAVSWSASSKQFATASADQTVKLWDVEAGKSTTTWTIGESIANHQVGVVWPAARTDGIVISLSLSGDLNYLEARSPKPVRVVQGHQKNITSACLGNARTTSHAPTLWTGSYDGRICAWDLSSGVATVPEGEGHTNQVSGLTATVGSEPEIHSVAWDDTLRAIGASPRSFSPTTQKTTAQPLALAPAHSSNTLVATTTGLTLHSPTNTPLASQATTSTPTALATVPSASQSTLVALATSDNILYFYALKDTTFVLQHSLPAYTSPCTALAFHTTPAHTLLAAGHANGKILVYDVRTQPDVSATLVTDRWGGHTAKVTSVAWRADGAYAVSGGLDTNLFVWSVERPGKKVKVGNAHKDGVAGVAWVDDRVVSVGGDAAVKTWRVVGLA